MKYEYKVIYESFMRDAKAHVYANTLNMDGKDGWELVTVLGPLDTSTHGPAFAYFFKRAIAE